MSQYNTIRVELIMNPNFSDHSIFSVKKKLGDSWLTDKYRHTILGTVKDKSVYEYYESYDEDTDYVIESMNLIKECESQDAAIQYAKEYFHVTKVIV